MSAWWPLPALYGGMELRSFLSCSRPRGQGTPLRTAQGSCRVQAGWICLARAARPAAAEEEDLSITCIFTWTGDGLVTRGRWQRPHLLLHLADHRYRLRGEHPHCRERQHRQETRAGRCPVRTAHGDALRTEIQGGEVP